MTNKVAVAIDFGNLKLCIGVIYKDKVEIIKNEENFSSFSQMLISKDGSLRFGIEAENSYAANYDNCYKEFKYNILKKNDKSVYHAKIVEVLQYYKIKSEDYVRSRFDKSIKNIDKVLIAVPSYDDCNENGWSNFLQKSGLKMLSQFMKKSPQFVILI